MKIPLSWIKRFISTNKSAQEIGDFLTLCGIEVDKIDRCNFSFKGVIIALVKEIYPHENADKLRIAKVFDGKKDHMVVCGAPNLALNKKVAFAPIGAILDMDSLKPFTIAKAKIRGVESKGMLCSEKELGIGPNHEGIILLDDASPIGMDFIEYYKDPVFDITLTPNLGHCRSVLGIVRELARLQEEEIALPQIKIKQSTGKQSSQFLTVSNQIKEFCPQFAVRIITGIEVKPSPFWLKSLLEKSDIRSINNVVDITNFVLHELGQPLHAYDYVKLKNKELTVRESKKGEKIVTLDGKEHLLDEGHMVICSFDKPVGIAGIMGGEETAVSDSTHSIVLEAAEFSSSRIRKSCRELKIRSQSSSRFENGIDRGGILTALDYAAFLLQELAGACVCEGVINEGIEGCRPSFLTVRLSKINKTLGTILSLNEVESFLASLGFAITTDGADLLQLKIPSYRNDIKEEVDIIEEVARVYGYVNILNPFSKHITSKVPHHPLYVLEKLLRTNLSSFGLQEFLTCSLISKELSTLYTQEDLFETNPAKVLYAKSLDQSILRPSLLPGLLSSMEHNKNNGSTDIAVFEIGKIFSKEKNSYTETPSLGILLSGQSAPYYYDTEVKKFDFFHLKGILENLFSSLNLKETKLEKSSHKIFHPGVQGNISINGDIIVTFGKIHPSITSNMKLEEETFFAEVNIYLLEKYRQKNIIFQNLPLFPSSYRDVTFTVDRKKELNELFLLLEKIAVPELKEYRLESVYQDIKNAPNTKNITFRFIYRDDHNTLDDNAIGLCHEKVLSLISKVL
jgi:phenylalanyl-tRNA synthetase beta chain